MIETTLSLRSDAPIGTISPRLYGQFAEHLGRCSYDGLWIGNQKTNVKQYNGFRADVVDALKAMPVPLLRWPGGCYADHYHWRDGIGKDRPIRLGMSCGLQVEDDNTLGTHEFINLCRMLGAEPYLAGNMGSGSAQELCDWIEYCNSAVSTNLVRERSANGSRAPFGVKLWGVGNENWGCGGNYDAESYAREYRRYATMLRHVDPSAELVACGQDDDWNVKFLQTNSNPRHFELMDHLSIHRYWIHGGWESNFSEQQYYDLLAEAEETEDFVRRSADYVREYAGDSKHPVGIALDEWGVWHPEARPFGPDSDTHREPITYEQAGTLRDAVAAAIAFEGFHHQCDVLTLANLAQVVNVIHAVVMTEDAAMWVTPTYYTFMLHTPHLDATALPVDVASGAALPGSSVNAVTATASVKAGVTAVTLINRHYDQSASVRLNAASTTAMTQAQILAADDPRAVNSASDPAHVQLANLTVAPDGAGQWRVELPPHSVATIQFR